MAIGVNWANIWDEQIWGPIWAGGGSSADDSTPNPFVFADQAGVGRETVITSNSITVSGINTAAVISVINGLYEINGSGNFLSAPSTVLNGDTVRVRHTSSANYLGTVSTTLTIGGISDTFTSQTLDAPGPEPEPLALRTPRSRTIIVGRW